MDATLLFSSISFSHLSSWTFHLCFRVITHMYKNNSLRVLYRNFVKLILILEILSSYETDFQWLNRMFLCTWKFVVVYFALSLKCWLTQDSLCARKCSTTVNALSRFLFLRAVEYWGCDHKACFVSFTLENFFLSFAVTGNDLGFNFGTYILTITLETYNWFLHIYFALWNLDY